MPFAIHPLLFAVALCLVAATVRAAPAIVPAPVRVVEGEGVFTLGQDTRILTADAEARSVAEMLANRLRACTGLPLPVENARLSDRPENSILLVAGEASGELGAEGYALEVDRERIVMQAPGRAGLLHGVQTLRQLLPPELESASAASGVEWTVPAVRILDQPRFGWRGYMLDSSRHMQTVPFIKRTLDLMAYHKLNVFHWHIVDDNGWRLESKVYPKLTEIGAWRTERDGSRYGGFYTQAEVRDIVAYAAERGITVLPEIEMPGHSAGAIAAYPWLSCRPEDKHLVPPIGGGIIPVCAGKESTYEFFEKVLDEAMELFPSEIIHIGGDEVVKDNWKQCPDCQAMMKREGLKDEAQLQHYFINRMAEYLKSKGRRLQGWNEIMQGGPLPDGVVMQQWLDPNSAADAARAGNDVIASPVAWAYFDYSYDTTPMREVYEAHPIPPGLTPEEQKHILGPQANLWTEWLKNDREADDYTWPRLIALAEMAWTPPAARNWDDFVKRLDSTHYRRLALMGLGTPDVPADEVEAHLRDYTDNAPGVAIGDWAPEMLSETDFHNLDWDMTALVDRGGAYSVWLDYQSGAHGILLDGASLLENGKEVAKDAHDGFAGFASRQDRFRLFLHAYHAGAKYTLRVRARGDGGTDSHGRAVLRGKGHH